MQAGNRKTIVKQSRQPRKSQSLSSQVTISFTIAKTIARMVNSKEPLRMFKGKCRLDRHAARKRESKKIAQKHRELTSEVVVGKGPQAQQQLLQSNPAVQNPRKSIIATRDVRVRAQRWSFAAWKNQRGGGRGWRRRRTTTTTSRNMVGGGREADANAEKGSQIGA